MDRSYDHEGLQKILSEDPKLISYRHNFKEWVSASANIALEENGSFGLFTYELPGVYAAHYFFKARGKKAFELANRMLKRIFTEYDARVIMGLTPVENKAAAWMTRRLGFTDNGLVSIENKDYHLFTLGREAFKEI